MKRKKSTLNRSNYWNKLVHRFYNLNNKVKKLLKNNASAQEVSIQLSRLQNLYKKLERLQHKVGITIAGTALALMLTTTNANAQDFKLQGYLMGDEVTNIQSGFFISFPEFKDIDKDGDLDLYLGGAYDIKTFNNDNNSFSESILVTSDIGNQLSETYSFFDFGDIDSDGDLDLVVTAYRYLILYKNEDGNYVYNDTLRTSNGDVIYENDILVPEFIDLDGDGDMDLVTGSFNGYIYKFLNDGDGNLTDDGLLQADGANIQSSFLLIPEFSDFDNDGDMDLIANSEYYILFYQNNNGTFSFEDTLKIDETPIMCIFPTIADLDQDGDMDIYSGSFGGYVLEFLNDGSNNFEDPDTLKAIGTFGFPEFSIPTVVDIDKNGSLETYVGTHSYILQFDQNNDFDFSFTDTLSADGSIFINYLNAPSYADIDDDGSLELINSLYGLFIYDIDENQNYTLIDTLKDDNGDYVLAQMLTRAIFNDSGDNLDLYVNRNRYILKYTIESGVAIFADTLKTSDGNPIKDNYGNMAFGDIDMDGDTDLLLGGYSGQIIVYKKDGDNYYSTGALKADGKVIDVELLSVPTLIDIDEDGDLDLILGEYYDGIAKVYLFRNDDIILSAKEIPTQSVLVYPNPTSGLINIENTLNYSIDVYNVNGQIVRTYKNINNDRQTIDLTNEQKGVYIIKLYNDQEVRTAKIILK